MAMSKREKTERQRRRAERKRESQRKAQELQGQLAKRQAPYQSSGTKPLNPVRPDDVFRISSSKGGHGKSSAGA